MAFLALNKKKLEAFFNIRFSAQEVIRGHVHWTETNLAMPSKPEVTEEILSVLEKIVRFSRHVLFLL